jgi:hypothetical protein|uniref:Uncharacterized protein n=1 Tax=Myoviridae sp. ctXXl13 TaxID=2827691 RepID=A0A8S5TJK6_9CAUD|nr:MAG TPA: hypothetical protein [Myoviridae sp. ctXXl13]
MNKRNGVLDAMIRISASIIAAGAGSLLSDAANNKFNKFADNCEAKIRLEEKKNNSFFNKIFHKKK